MTGGRYFRATDKEKLKAIYDEINQLEKSKVEVLEHISYHELFLHWVLAALGCSNARWNSPASRPSFCKRIP